MRWSPIIVVLATLAVASGSLQLHNPRGSNDRLNEASADRVNAARLFDSENNARGGYCWGPELSYYEGTAMYCTDMLISL